MWDAVGLSDRHGQTYEALLDHRQAAVEDLAAATGMSTGQVRRVVEELVHLGLASRLPGTPARFAPMPPELVASDLLSAQQRRQRRLQAHLKQLGRTYAARQATRHPAELIEVLEGTHNVRSAFRRLQREATQQVRVFDRPPYFNPGGGESYEVNEEELDALDQARVSYRVIYERSVLEAPGRMADIWAGVRQGELARIAPSLPLKLALADDTIALVNSTSDFDVATAYLVHPSAVLDALVEVFEATWSRSVALNQATRDERDVDDSHDQLVGMLAGGATDEGIARALGVSVRTVQRHIHSLMSEVGAGTRLQLGMELVRRGRV